MASKKHCKTCDCANTPRPLRKHAKHHYRSDPSYFMTEGGERKAVFVCNNRTGAPCYEVKEEVVDA